MKRAVRYLAVTGLIAATALVGASAPASAGKQVKVKPLAMFGSWYWEHGESRTIETPAGAVQADTNNEYCPTQPSGGGAYIASEICAAGRLPVRIVAGDYETPDQLSAVTFDTLTTIPIGSKVHKFTATFLEAKAGCSKNPQSVTGQGCEATERIDLQNHELQACLVTQVFGEGAARPYEELPKYECSKSDPTAKRKETKINGETEHVWTFDLTGFAKKWAAGKLGVSAILLTGAEPKESGPRDTFRVVLEGPLEPKGIQTLAVITPAVPDIPTVPPVPPAPPDDVFVPGTPPTSGTPGTPGTAGTTGTSSGTSGSDDAGLTGAAAEPGEAKAPVDAEETKTQPTAADLDAPAGGLPGYAWLGLLAGMAGFSLVRQVVLESGAGIRPDGVLAHIQKLNATRRGGQAASWAGQPGLLGAVAMTIGSMLIASKTVAKGIGSRLSKVRGIAKR
ncbi:MAG: hypothetical protein M3280_01680 [Actinomycetota bacterium]|nr:hypothetical protein [Actinomycetota bacterium]